ncbi:hypothetical protein Dac01nite_01430 [Demequina activiva]|uniref:Uncharacterized protein n=1 Tax=Demequina activiva TaxID=1582364 RepID=A0A919Q1X2_9MICO|nr:hypothetical protein Dac01nite_01430 [Demequina activiva]
MLPLSAPGYLGSGGNAVRPGIVPAPREHTMDKWKIMSNSRVVRATAGASTLVAAAVVVGAGWKWA